MTYGTQSGHARDRAWKSFTRSVAKKRRLGGKDRSKANAQPLKGYKKRRRR